MKISRENEKTGIDVLSEDEELSNIYDEWIDLYARDKKPNPFKSPLWLEPWREIFKGGELRTFAFHIDGKLEAIAPMHIHSFTHPYIRELTFLGTGNSDYTDILANERYEDEFLPALFDEIFSMDDWDIVNLLGLREDSPLLDFARKNLPKADIIQEEIAPVLLLPDSIDEYNKLISAKKLKGLRWAERRLADMDELKFEKAGIYSIGTALESLFLLHNKSQETKGKSGVFSDYKMKSFIKRVSMGLLENNMMELYGLKLGRRVIASLFALKQDRTMYYYIGGYEPELGKYSPGALCIYNVIKDAISTGIKEFDFLKGNESYKFEWGAVKRGIYNLKYQI